MYHFKKGDRVVSGGNPNCLLKAGGKDIVEVVSSPIGRNIFVRTSGDRGVWVKASHLKLDDSSPRG